MLLPFQLPAYIKRRHRHTLARIKSTINFFLSIMNPTAENNSSSSPPPPFDPKKPSIPVSYPIKTLEELESRAYFDSFHYPFNIAKVKLQSSTALPDRRRMLVCHDMAGGYTDDDKLIQGGKNPEAYSIWHWYLMDVFVYFSHNLVTLPPPGWTNTAHKHGVKVLGTFIMEWAEGAVLANKLLSTVESAQMYAERLAELALALGFDGWLINMEVDVKQVSNLKEFVSHLTKTMHSSIPGSLIIWYDSVTVSGKLDWQNQLNSSNKPFFDVCDGIFVNYTWQESYPKLSAEVAGNRKFDVYMGIDVFGRGTYGGGQWNTNVALDVIRENDVSAAIFAPGWVYENHEKQEFQTLQNRWWGLIEKSWGTVQRYPQVLPFYSDFNQACGYHIEGVVGHDYPWNHISSQSFQPFLEYSGDSDPVQCYFDLDGPSYSGGGNLTFKGTLGKDAIFTARLFEGELFLGNSPVYLRYSSKSNGSSLVGLVLCFRDGAKERKTVFLPSEGNNLYYEQRQRNILLIMNRFASQFTKVIMSHYIIAEPNDPWCTREFKLPMMEGHTLTKISALCYKLEIIKELEQLEQKPGSSSRRHMSLPDSSKYYEVLEQIRTRHMKFYTILGHISISTSSVSPREVVVDVDKEDNFPPSNLWALQGEYVELTSDSREVKHLNIKLTWQLKSKNGNTDLFPRYLIYVQGLSLDGRYDDIPLNENSHLFPDEVKENPWMQYLGVAETEAFYVSDLEVPVGTCGFKFTIQAGNLNGQFQKENDCPFLLVKVEGS